MTIDPDSPRGRRWRNGRGLRIAIALLLSIGAQGMLLNEAIRDPSSGPRWVAWAAVLGIIIAAFIVEDRIDRRRDR